MASVTVISTITSGRCVRIPAKGECGVRTWPMTVNAVVVHVELTAAGVGAVVDENRVREVLNKSGALERLSSFLFTC